MRSGRCLLSGLAAIGVPALVQAQGAVRSLTLEQAIRTALRDHPTLAREAALGEVADARLTLARTGYLPDLDVALQANRATINVVRGAAFPMAGIPILSGPIIDPVLDRGSFGALAGLSSSWDLLGLLARVESVDAALHDREGTRAGADVARLEVAFNVADVFLGALGRAEGVRAARASEERSAVFESVVRAFTENDLRPGADLARARAEAALASTQLIRAVEAQSIAEIDLAEAVGEAGRVSPLPEHLLDPPSPRDFQTEKRNPALDRADAAVAASASRERAETYAYLPRVDLVAALWSRTSGFGSPGDLSSGVSNWGAGLVVSWPILELFARRARSRVASAETQATAARRSEVTLQVASQVETARALLDGARRVAANTPLALAAARASEEQAAARYRSGLAGVLEVAEAQRLLAQAELEDSEARLGVRTAMLVLARALGDLEPFLSEVGAEGSGGTGP